VICTLSDDVWKKHGSQEEAGKPIEDDGAADAGGLAAKGTTTPSSAMAENGPSTGLTLILDASRLRHEPAKPRRLLVRNPTIAPPLIRSPIPASYLLLSAVGAASSGL
jgi:hypothetical protein